MVHLLRRGRELFLLTLLCTFEHSLSQLVSSQLAGLPIEDLGSGNMKSVVTKLCTDRECRRASSIVHKTIGPCDAGFRCSSCESLANVNLGQYCERIPPPSPQAIVLNSGMATPEGILRRKSLIGGKEESLNLNLKWFGPEQIGTESCSIDNFNAQLLTRTLQDPSRPFNLFMRIMFLLTVFRVPNKSFGAPDLTVKLIFHPPDSSLDSAGRYRGGGRCPKVLSTFNLETRDTVKEGQLAELIKAVTIPWDTKYLTTGNFEASITCTSKLKTCDLSGYRICARLLCASMSQEQSMKLAVIQETLTNPQPVMAPMASQQNEPALMPVQKRAVAVEMPSVVNPPVDSSPVELPPVYVVPPPNYGQMQQQQGYSPSQMQGFRHGNANAKPLMCAFLFVFLISIF